MMKLIKTYYPYFFIIEFESNYDEKIWENKELMNTSIAIFRMAIHNNIDSFKSDTVKHITIDSQPISLN